MSFSTWRKSSISGETGSDCVEVAFAVTGVAVRDSKNSAGPTLSLPVGAWRCLLAEGGLRDMSAAAGSPAS